MKKAELKDRLREAMEMNNLKQTDLVSIGHFDKGQLSAWLSGRYKPKQVNIDKLASILGVSEAWLMGYDVPQDRNYQMHIADAVDDEGFREAKIQELSDRLRTIELEKEEKSIIEKYRSLDDHGKDIVDTVLSKEYERCKLDEEQTVVINEEMLRSIPTSARLMFLKYQQDDQIKLVARGNKK